MIGLKKLAPLSQPMKSNLVLKLGRTRFPARGARATYLLRILIGLAAKTTATAAGNVTIKMNLRFLVKFLGVDSWRPHPSLGRARKIRRRVFTSSIKRSIRKFHVLVVQ